jgi:hypothetical protein
VEDGFHPLPDPKGLDLKEEEHTDQDAEDSGRCHDARLVSCGVNETPEEDEEGHDHDDYRQNAAAPLERNAKVGGVHLVLYEVVGVLMVHPPTDPADPPVNPDLHGMKAQRTSAYEAPCRTYPRPLFDRSVPPGMA